MNEDGIAAAKAFNKRGSPVAFLTFKIEGENQIVLDRTAPSGSITSEDEWDAALEGIFFFFFLFFFFFFFVPGVFPDDEPRYALIKFQYLSPTDNVQRGASVFVMWVPGLSKVKQKMMATMFSKPVKQQLEGGVTIQAGSMASLNYDDVLATVLSKKTVR